MQACNGGACGYILSLRGKNIAGSFSPTEVALLAGAPARTVEKAIEQKVLPVRFGRLLPGDRRRRRLLTAAAVGCAAVFEKLDLQLPVPRKRKLADRLASLPVPRWKTARVELVPAVELDVGKLAGDAMRRAERYRAARHICARHGDDTVGGSKEAENQPAWIEQARR